LKKAFDSVNHELLFRRLGNLGYPNKIINTIRKIYKELKINGFEDSENGLPQGDPYSTDAFNDFINPLIIQLAKMAKFVYAYADDIALLCETEY